MLFVLIVRGSWGLSSFIVPTYETYSGFVKSTDSKPPNTNTNTNTSTYGYWRVIPTVACSSFPNA
jgi:hypothetical protein